MSYGRFLKPAYYPNFIPHLVGRGSAMATVVTRLAGTLNTGSSVYDLIDGKPIVRTSYDTSGATTTKVVIAFDFGVATALPFDFIAVLNHNVESADGVIKLRNHTSAFTAATDGADVPITWLVGGTTGSSGDPPIYQTLDGSSVGTFTEVSDRRYWAIIIEPHTTDFSATDLEIGQVMLGKRWVAATGPDYNSIRRNTAFDSKVNRSIGGQGYGSAAWIAGDRGTSSSFGQPFHTAATSYWRRHGGRRLLKFRQTFVQDTTLTPSDLGSGTSDDSFDKRVHQITAGSLYPLVFCPDSTSTTLGDYMFARLESDWELQQVAANVYSYEIQVTEEL